MMRVSLTQKLAILSVAGVVAAWWAASAILANSLGAKADVDALVTTANDSANRQNRAVGRLTHNWTLPQSDPRVGAAEPKVNPGLSMPAPMVSSTKLETFEVAAANRQVSVAARVSIEESLQNPAFMWSLRVYSGPPERKPLSRRDYREQIFRAAHGVEATPTFQETFELAPGRYVIRLTLHRMPENFDLAKLKDERTDRSTYAVSAVKEILIAD